jgi:hypothetical protein
MLCFLCGTTGFLNIYTAFGFKELAPSGSSFASHETEFPEPYRDDLALVPLLKELLAQ